MFWFELWREYKLSIAELYSLFPKMEIVYFDEKVLLVDNIDEVELESKFSSLWGIIKVFKILDNEYKTKNTVNIYEDIMSEFTLERKNNYAINFYWKSRFNQKDFLVKAKKYFQKNDFSSRFVNQDFQNIKSYLVTKEKLLENKTDFNLVFFNDTIYLWYTGFVQDIDSYSKRDFWKTRDMIIGMLPPKLAQMMINFASTKNIDKQVIYDPFCGLGTVLLESIISGNTEVYWSDLNPEMVATTKKNVEFTKNEFKNNLNDYEVVLLDAKNIASSPILKNHRINAIVTEWYLWEIFWKNSIDLEKVKKQRQILATIYEDFFSWLKKIWFGWRIVISFPFWEINWKYNYFEEIPDIIYKYCFVDPFFPEWFELKPSRSWSLLYKRPDQTVWREIFKLRIKK